jgi:Flp pilus assembly protein TadD
LNATQRRTIQSAWRDRSSSRSTLAAVLIAMGRKDDAREAAGRSLEIDEVDEVAMSVVISIRPTT